ncbi:MAG: hypothetical protein N4A47_02440 [Clostridia bacterium]|jgi:hypothetical protein|nr:hypothetical protein [Clostridia bacterium]
MDNVVVQINSLIDLLPASSLEETKLHKWADQVSEKTGVSTVEIISMVETKVNFKKVVKETSAFIIPEKDEEVTEKAALRIDFENNKISAGQIEDLSKIGHVAYNGYIHKVSDEINRHIGEGMYGRMVKSDLIEETERGFAVLKEGLKTIFITEKEIFRVSNDDFIRMDRNYNGIDMDYEDETSEGETKEYIPVHLDSNQKTINEDQPGK